MLQKNQEVTVTVTDMTFDGDGIGRVRLPEGEFPVFVRSAVVGDTLRCRIVKVLRSYAAAIPVEILTPSPDRVVPDCPVSDKCGGCSFSCVGYEAELRYKTETVRKVYRLNYGEGISVTDCVASPLISGYRNKLQLPLSPEGKFGFYSRKTHRVIPCAGCAAGHPDFRPVTEAVQKWIRDQGISPYDETARTGQFRHLYLRRGTYTGEMMVCLVLTKPLSAQDQSELLKTLSTFDSVKSVWVNLNPKPTNVMLGDRQILLAGNPTIRDEMNGVSFSISPRSFYQVNTRQAEAIYAAAAQELSPDDVLLDLYCGIGTIGLTCARSVRRVIGVEAVEDAVKDARNNAERNGIKNAEFYTADAADLLEVLETLPERPTAVIVDPPRKGLSSEALNALRTLAPEKLIYISCDPATQARDLRLLSDLYRAGDVRPYDMFPRTGHVESLVTMTRRTGSAVAD